RTVKLWDLRKGIVYGCLSLHPGPVVAVEYSTEHSLLFSASGSFIRAWDLRESTTKPVKTLCSSGNTMSGTANISALQPGESPITAMIIGSTGNLYTAASSDRVRIWDLRKFSCTGKVQGGHQAAVMCLESWRSASGTDLLATGSKDHYIKVFEIPQTGGLIYPTLNLLPPHYDGIQVLLATDKANDGQSMELFSGSRDTCIKRWDLDSGDLKLSINNAHKGWISGMAMFRDMLLTTCRGGVMRLWDARTCDALAEVKTSNPISGLVANDTRFFTASSNGSVQIWKLPENVDSLLSVKSNSNSNNNYKR
ncbi:kinesin-like protein KIF21A, partial [Culicoides brevitarsis]